MVINTIQLIHYQTIKKKELPNFKYSWDDSRLDLLQKNLRWNVFTTTARKFKEYGRVASQVCFVF